MGSKTRLSSYCTKRGDNTVNLVTPRKTNARLARPIIGCKDVRFNVVFIHFIEVSEYYYMSLQINTIFYKTKTALFYVSKSMSTFIVVL